MAYEAVLLFAVAFFAAWLFFFVSGAQDATSGWRRHALQLFIGTVFAAYFLWCWLRGGQTLAMKAWHVRLVEVTPQRALIRLVLAAAAATHLHCLGPVRPRSPVPARPPRGHAPGFDDASGARPTTS